MRQPSVTPVALDHFIARERCQILDLRFRYKHAVERITMMPGEFSNPPGMRGAQRQMVQGLGIEPLLKNAVARQSRPYLKSVGEAKI